MASRPAHPAPRSRPRRNGHHRRRSARPWGATVPMILAAIPSLPRPVLARLTQQMVDRLDEIDGDPDFEPAGFHEGYQPDYRSAEHRDAALYLVGSDDDEDDDPAEDDGISNEDDDPREDDDPDTSIEDAPHDHEGCSAANIIFGSWGVDQAKPVSKRNPAV